MLRFDGITARAGAFQLRADFAISSGALTAVIGPSGAGKSTLLSVAAGFLSPERGSVRIGADDVTGVAPGDRALSILFQDNNLFPHLDVTQNLGLGIRPDLRLSADDRARLNDVLAYVGLADMGARRPSELSGGQQSRVALARVLLRRRPVLLLDEPFSALGPKLRRDMLALVTRIARDEALTVLMVTHDPGDAQAFADDCVFVDAGRAEPPVATGALFADPPQALSDYLGQ
ncbi:MAG: ATP-binding cassette domain-containing protein [Pseudomonadota bacterium]